MSTQTAHAALLHPAATAELARCREDIDRVDAVIVALLLERTRLAVRAGRLKAAGGQALTAPAREAAVIAHVMRLAGPPLGPDAIGRIFERIIDETRAAERQAMETAGVD